MKKEEAVKIMIDLQNQLSNSGINMGNWSKNSEYYIKKFIGDGSPQHVRILHLTRDFTIYTDQHTYKTNIATMAEFMKDCIGIIFINGIYKDPKKNFLYDIDNKWIAGTLITIIISLLTLAFYLGEQKNETANVNKANEELKKENQILKERINKLIHTP
jgi:hypothetical protein